MAGWMVVNDGSGTPGSTPPGLVIPGIDLLDVIGRGGFGVVYRGHQRALDRYVAVKVIAVEGDEATTLRRVQREMQALGRLSSHNAVVTVYDAGVLPGHAYLVMRFLAGGTLVADRLRGGALPLGFVLTVGARVASALAAAHGNDILHGDLKPANILLSDEGEAFLADFGVARLVGDTTTQAFHTPGYAAPELWRGEQGPEADVWALGATFAALLTGRLPGPKRTNTRHRSAVGCVPSSTAGERPPRSVRWWPAVWSTTRSAVRRRTPPPTELAQLVERYVTAYTDRTDPLGGRSAGGAGRGGSGGAGGPGAVSGAAGGTPFDATRPNRRRQRTRQTGSRRQRCRPFRPLRPMVSCSTPPLGSPAGRGAGYRCSRPQPTPAVAPPTAKAPKPPARRRPRGVAPRASPRSSWCSPPPRWPVPCCGAASAGWAAATGSGGRDPAGGSRGEPLRRPRAQRRSDQRRGRDRR